MLYALRNKSIYFEQPFWPQFFYATDTYKQYTKNYCICFKHFLEENENI